jgi:hypothetical protein
VFQRTCSGTNCSITAYDSDIISALDYVYSLRATYNIASANLSLGGDPFTATCDASFPGYKTVIDSLRSANIATAIASGNNGSANSITAPGCISSAISVGSTNKDNTISSFSNSASFLGCSRPAARLPHASARIRVRRVRPRSEERYTFDVTTARGRRMGGAQVGETDGISSVLTALPRIPGCRSRIRATAL